MVARRFADRLRSTGDQPEPVGLADLYVVDPENGRSRMLPETPNRSVSILGWSADSDEVFLTEFLGTTRHLIAVTIGGGSIRQVTEGAGLVGSAAMAAGAGTLALTWETNDKPGEVYVTSMDAFAPERISAVNSNAPRPPMGRTELLSWEAPDGTPVEGLLTYPVGYEAGTRVPLILNVHGGPAGVFRPVLHGFSEHLHDPVLRPGGHGGSPPQPARQHGLRQGVPLRQLQDWGTATSPDLLAGVDEVIEMGVAHPDSLLLMGWSYGGFMTSFAVTQTDRFRAASMGAGLPNLVSMVTTTDIGDYLVGHLGGEYFDDYETYEKHSAIYHIKNVTTPTQVIHGAQDLRVPFTQGQEFFNSLRRLGVDTEMVVYPRTPHGPTEPKFLMDVSGADPGLVQHVPEGTASVRSGLGPAAQEALGLGGQFIIPRLLRQGECGLQVPPCLLLQTFRALQDATRQEGPSLVRLQGDRGVEVFDGFVLTTGLPSGPATVKEAEGVVGLQADAFVVVGDRLLVHSQFSLCESPHHVGSGIGRIQANGFVVGGNRLMVLPPPPAWRCPV